MKEIPLSQGKVALVDDEDYEVLAKWKWHYQSAGNKRYGYAQRKTKRAQNGKQGAIFMHRVILNTPHGYETDHINGNGLDNRKENLRVATTAQNQWNTRKPKNNTSGFKGVSWHKDDKKWRTSINFKNKSIYLGSFNDKNAAARAYTAAIIKYHGNFAYLNHLVG